MSRLVLMRHAKSAYPPATIDFARPLSERGRRDAAAAAAWFAEGSLLIDTAVISTALRTQQTWEALQLGMPQARKCERRNENLLYEAGWQRILAVLSDTIGVTESPSSTLVLAHNPGCVDFIVNTTRPHPLHKQIFEKHPTSAIAVIDFRDIGELADGHGSLVDYVIPRG